MLEQTHRNLQKLLRRKNFFQMSQQQGQDKRAFLEQIKSAAAEADIEGMNLEDAAERAARCKAKGEAQ